MGWESINMVRFDLGTLLQGQMRITKHKSAYNSLIIGPRGWNENQPIENHELGIFWCGRISWAGNLLVWSDLTLDPSFQVKRR